jgi:hypothetical protein
MRVWRLEVDISGRMLNECTRLVWAIEGAVEKRMEMRSKARRCDAGITLVGAADLE